MVDSKFLYCFDTSAFLDGWSRYYPPEVFHSLWEDNMNDLVGDGRIISSIEVLNELEEKDDDIFKWCKLRSNIFIEIDDKVQDNVKYIMQTYPRLVDTKTGKSGRDPFVIALAMGSLPYLKLVTGERGGSEKSPKIPFVCQKENIPCINFLDLIKEQKWKF